MNGSNPFVYQNSAQPGSNAKAKKHFPLKIVLIVLLFLALAGGGGYLYYLKDKEVQELRASGGYTLGEYTDIITQVKKLIIIPDDETPQVAVIDDPAKLQATDAKFYANAQKGQYLIILPKSQKAIIYDKATNKIINFSLYSIKYDLIPDGQIPEAEKPLSIEIRYVDSVSMDTVNTVSENLKKASTFYKVLPAVKATNTDYTGLNVYLLNQKNKPNLSQNILAHTGTSQIVTALPAGEAESTADVVIILGKN